MTTILIATLLVAPWVGGRPVDIDPGLVHSLDRHLQSAESRSRRGAATEIAPDRLARMGLAGVRVLSDAEASQVRGSPCPAYDWDGGTFQVIVAHALANQYNFLYTSGFAPALFAPLRAPVGGMGVHPR